jgi:hypothetical protein
MTRTITWKVVLTEKNQIASLENATGLPIGDVESQLIIIGLLENLKQKHLEKLNTLFEKTVKGSGKKDDLDL